MARKDENSGFICKNCKKQVEAIKKGSIRNHCPFCLCSLHVDNSIGDRLNPCKGIMYAVFIEYNTKKTWQILHKCSKCGYIRKNILADDDDMQKVYAIINNLTKQSGLL